MNNENYLWDRSGEPDPEILKLEGLLAGFAMKPARKRQRIAWRLAVPLALAATLLIGFVLLKPATQTSWSSAGRSLREGETIHTSASAGTTISSESIGKVDVEPDSLIRVGLTNLDLRAGTIHALIWAPPGRFTVETPSAKAVDLGCKYTLQVTQNGTGELTVELGLVAFEWRGTESFIPAGAMCRTRTGGGPGIPRYLDAPAALSSALDNFEARGDEGSLEVILGTARPSDAISLWHLMHRAKGQDRAKVFDRFAELKSLSGSGMRDAIVRGDPSAFDAAWNTLDLGDAGFWRQWKQHWK